jgi:tRNA threonylcarbamoyladenosine modification (KEOPS) complex Cgi121 subunit
MCTGIEPMALAGIGANLAGAAINHSIQSQAVSEQNRQNQIAMQGERAAREAEAQRQLGWENEQAAAAAAALTQADPTRVAQASQQTVEAPNNAVVAMTDDYNVPALQGQTSNQNVAASIGNEIAGRAAQTREMLRSAAMLQAQGGQMNDVAQALFSMGSQVANTGSNRRGSMNAARLETTIPVAEVRPSSSPIGDLLMLGGQAMSGRAGQRAGALLPGGNSRPLNAIPLLGALNLG